MQIIHREIRKRKSLNTGNFKDFVNAKLKIKLNWKMYNKFHGAFYYHVL